MIHTNLRRLVSAATTGFLLSACGGGSTSSTPAPAPAPGPTQSAVVSTAPIGSTQASRPDVDSYVQEMIKEYKIPGLSLAVMENGQLVYAKAYGYANLESMLPATPEHRFEIGSVSKSFMALAVMMLVEEGKINLDARADTYLGPLPAAMQSITVRQLLSHTSGIQRLPDEATQATLATRTALITQAEMFEYIKSRPLLFAPGTSYSYSNMGYHLLGIIVGKVSGKFYGDFLQERVFGPLQMRDTRIIKPYAPTAGMASGYQQLNGVPRVYVHSEVMRSYHSLGSGSIESTTLDMAKYDAALHQGRLLTPDGLAKMWTPNALEQARTNPNDPLDADIHYGLGWKISTVNGIRKVYHGGGMPGFTSEFGRYPEAGVSVIVLANMTDSGAPHKVSSDVARMFRPALRH